MLNITLSFKRASKLQGIMLSVILTLSILFVSIKFNSFTSNVTPNAIKKITKDAIEAVQNATAGQVNVIALTTDKVAVAATIEELDGRILTIYESIEALAASIPVGRLFQLASDDRVVRIHKDFVRDLCSGGTIAESLKHEIPCDPVTGEPLLGNEISGVIVESVAVNDFSSIRPGIYANAELTGAGAVWLETKFGANSTVVIIDTGVWSASPLLVGNVIGGIDISPDIGTPYEGYNATTNHLHGTACAHILASHAQIIFHQGHPWGEAIFNYDKVGSWRDSLGRVNVSLFGIAPAASIYAIKVFPHTGDGVPSSLIMHALDMAIQMKVNGTLDVDVISMSLGGFVGADGEDPIDLLVDAATKAGITVVVAAGNGGPAPLRVGSPGSAKTAVTVGAAMDPIHEWVFGDIYFSRVYGQPPGNGLGDEFWYPHDYVAIVDFSSRGPSADGRLKPDVVATGSWCFLGPYTDNYIYIGGGTSFSAPQVAGVAALLNSYIESQGLPYGPKEIKKAIVDGSVYIPGYTEEEQGAGYVNALNALNIIKSGNFGNLTIPWLNHVGNLWFPPIEVTYLKNGMATFYNIKLEPAKYRYFAFWVSSEVDSFKITLSNVVLAVPEKQNPFWGDAGIIYLSTAERGGSDGYLIKGLNFFRDREILVTSDAPFQPGVIRLVLTGDFSNCDSIMVGEMRVEVTEVWVNSVDNKMILYNNWATITAQLKVYHGKIERYCGSVRQGETDIYTYKIMDANGFAFVFLSWSRDWSCWGTSDLDLIIIDPRGSIIDDGATASSPEVATLSAGPGQYAILVDGCQVYFDKEEYYYLEIVYFADKTPLWSSTKIGLKNTVTIKSPVYGLAVVWLYDEDFDTWYIGGFTEFKKHNETGREPLRFKKFLVYRL